MGLALRLAFLAPFACGNHGGTPWWKEEVADARRCTSRGREVACLDVSTCARGAAKKVAIASVFDAHVPLEATRGVELKSSTRLQCATVSTQALRPCFENSTRAIDPSKNQPNRLRIDREREV